MFVRKTLAPILLSLAWMAFPYAVRADLVVTVGTTPVDPDDLTGDYGTDEFGRFRIEMAAAGTTPRVEFEDTNARDGIGLFDVLIIGTQAATGNDPTIKGSITFIKNDFQPGPNGLLSLIVDWNGVFQPDFTKAGVIEADYEGGIIVTPPGFAFSLNADGTRDPMMPQQNVILDSEDGLVTAAGPRQLDGSLVFELQEGDRILISAARTIVVPEPSVTILTGLATLGLLGYGWGRRKRATQAAA